MKRTERVATKRRENIAEMKIRKEKKLRKLDPPLPPLTATAIWIRIREKGLLPFWDLELYELEGVSSTIEKIADFTVREGPSGRISVRSKE